jgi:hypothetical protein
MASSRSMMASRRGTVVFVYTYVRISSHTCGLEKERRERATARQENPTETLHVTGHVVESRRQVSSRILTHFRGRGHNSACVPASRADQVTHTCNSYRRGLYSYLISKCTLGLLSSPRRGVSSPGTWFNLLFSFSLWSTVGKILSCTRGRLKKQETENTLFLTFFVSILLNENRAE